VYLRYSDPQGATNDRPHHAQAGRGRGPGGCRGGRAHRGPVRVRRRPGRRYHRPRRHHRPRPWGQVVASQKLGTGLGTTYRIGFPVFQHRGLAEEIVPTATEDATHEAYCAAGVTTQWNTYPGDHALTDNEAIGDVITWLTARFAGQPTAGNC
jgi:Secretory lipase